MKLPNFFIVGAPKTGTTSLHKYLSEHPNIFMSKMKGPHYYSGDILNEDRVAYKDDYLNLFKNANQNHLAVGESSVLYLYSDIAIKKIAQDFPKAKLIILLRNPIEVIQSWHAEMVWRRLETNENFQSAWESTAKEKIDNIKKSKLDYRNIVRYGAQLQNALKFFPQSQIKIIFFEKFSSEPKTTYHEIINFLKLPHHNKNIFKTENKFKKYRIRILQDFLSFPPNFIVVIMKVIKFFFNVEEIGLFKKLLALNTSNPKKPGISSRLKKSIIENYYDDIHFLSKMLKKDLINKWFTLPNKN